MANAPPVYYDDLRNQNKRNIYISEPPYQKRNLHRNFVSTISFTYSWGRADWCTYLLAIHISTITTYIKKVHIPIGLDCAIVHHFLEGSESKGQRSNLTVYLKEKLQNGCANSKGRRPSHSSGGILDSLYDEQELQFGRRNRSSTVPANRSSVGVGGSANLPPLSSLRRVQGLHNKP